MDWSLLVEILTQFAYMLCDVFAVLSLFGSTLLLIGTAIAALFGRKFRVPDQLLYWAALGPGLGLPGIILIYLSPSPVDTVGLFFRMSRVQVAWMLAASVGLLILRGLIRPRRIRVRMRT